MHSISRRDIYICVGDKRYIYSLPQIIDTGFADAVKQFGILKKLDIGEDTIWFMENEDL
jgi:hypothetical protein